MSKATDQAMFLLSQTCGALRFMIENEEIPEEIAPTVVWAEECSCKLVNNYPHCSDLRKYDNWRKKKNEEWAAMGDSDDGWNPLVLIEAGLRYCEDLLEVIQNKIVLRELEALREAMLRIWEFKDSFEKDPDRQYKEAAQVVSEIYEIIGFQH